MPPQGNGGIPQRNPYQNGQGPEGQPNSRKEAWDAQYRRNHWSNQPENRNGQSAVPQNSEAQRGAFSGIPQEVVERPEEADFVPYENMELPEKEPVEMSSAEPIIVDNEQDAGIVLEAAEEALKQEEKGEGISEPVLELKEKGEGASKEVEETEKDSGNTEVKSTEE